MNDICTDSSITVPVDTNCVASMNSIIENNNNNNSINNKGINSSNVIAGVDDVIKAKA